MTVLRTTATQLFTESLSVLLAREVGDLNNAAELSKVLKCLVTIESAQYGLEDPACRLSARSSRCGYLGIMKYNVEIPNDLFVLSNIERRIRLEHKGGPAEGE